MHRCLLLALCLAALGGCKLTEERYKKRVAKAFCQWQERCQTADFYANFDKVGACVDATVKEISRQDDYYARKCRYQADRARKCIKAYGASCKKSASEYDTLFQPCYEVWDCAVNFNASTDSNPLF